MPVTTRHQLKKKEMDNHLNHLNHLNKPKKNNANIDFEDASKEWRKNKIKHGNCCFTYKRNQKQS